LLALHRAADAVIHNGFSVRFAWPLLLFPRRWLIVHQTFLQSRALHRWVARLGRNVANSTFIAGTLPMRSTVVANSYRTEIFRPIAAGPRHYDLVFLGRLIADKGPMLLLQALARLKANGVQPSALIIGSGGEEGAMRSFIAQHDLQVEFAGARFGDELAARLNQCRIMVVPSIWQEPFGIVALEGIACGCAVIGASGGGLPEAIGPCGITFKSGDADALAEAIAKLLNDPALLQSLRDAAPAHLARHTPQAIVDRYLDLLK
jgi:glycosyltransferase involved in cell wall biosynthesis